MYRENIDNLIKTALFTRDRTKLKVLRLIKAAFEIFSTSKDNKGNLNVLDDVQELKILKKLKKQWEEELEYFVKSNRIKESERLKEEIKMLEALLPAELSQEESETIVKSIVEGYLLGLPIEERASMKHLGAIVKLVKAKNPSIDGSLVACVYKKMINYEIH